MSFLRFYNFSRLNYLLACALVLPLVGCSGGDGGPASDSADTTFGDLNLSWIAPDQREDGVVFVPSLELAEFRVYYGREPGGYQNQVDIVDGSSDAQIVSVPTGLYYVVVTTVDKQGRESQHSVEVEVLVVAL